MTYLPSLPVSLRRLLFGAGLLVPIMVGGAGAPALVTRDPLPKDTASLDIPGIPNRPELVTVVPFRSYDGLILVDATVDGRHGTFVFDTGAPTIALNQKYVRRNLTTKSLDTVTALVNDPYSSCQDRCPYDVHVLHLGALVLAPPEKTGPPVPASSRGLILAHWEFWDQFTDVQILGNLGLNVMEPFETIIDYKHRRLVFIRLDSAGHRRIVVPAYRPTTTGPLVPDDEHHWGVQGVVDNDSKEFVVDTGAPWDEESDTTDQQVAARRRASSTAGGQRTQDTANTRVVWDHLSVAGRTFTFQKNREDAGDFAFGTVFLSQVGVVGFNLRTRHFMFYRT